jgi:hypothetical protein
MCVGFFVCRFLRRNAKSGGLVSRLASHSVAETPSMSVADTGSITQGLSVAQSGIQTIQHRGFWAIESVSATDKPRRVPSVRRGHSVAGRFYLLRTIVLLKHSMFRLRSFRCHV